MLVQLPSTNTVGPCQQELQFTSECIIFYICSYFTGFTQLYRCGYVWLGWEGKGLF